MTNNLNHISGEKSIFSITTKIEEKHAGVWMVGELYYTINNKQLGGGELCSLRDAMYLSESILNGKDKRDNEFIYDLDDHKIFNLITSALYEDGEEIYEYLNENTFAGNFNINIDVEGMIGEVILSVSKKDCGTKILYKYNNKLCVDVVEYGLIDRVIEDSYKFLSDFHKNELTLDH